MNTKEIENILNKASEELRLMIKKSEEVGWIHSYSEWKDYLESARYILDSIDIVKSLISKQKKHEPSTKFGIYLGSTKGEEGYGFCKETKTIWFKNLFVNFNKI